MSALLGTQPKFKQSPPILLRSISATRPPSAAVPAPVTRPAVPAPVTTTLYVPLPLFTEAGSNCDCANRPVINAIYKDDGDAGEEDERNGKNLLIRKSPKTFPPSINAPTVP